MLCLNALSCPHCIVFYYFCILSIIINNFTFDQESTIRFSYNPDIVVMKGQISDSKEQSAERLRDFVRE